MPSFVARFPSRLVPTAAVMVAACFGVPAATASALPLPATQPGVAATTEHDVIEQRRAFEQQFAVEAYAAHGHRDPKWDEDAVALIAAQADAVAEQAAVYYRTPSKVKPEQRRALAESVLAAGCDDAMALYMAGLALRDAGEQDGARAALRAANAAAPTSKYCSLYQLRMLNDLWELDDVPITTPAGKQRRDRLVVLMRATFADGTLFPTHRRAVWNFGSDLFNDSNRKRQLDVAEAIGDVPDADPWLFNVYRGDVEIGRAWAARGGGFAGTVTDEGWQGMSEHLAAAREHFAAAMVADPVHPHPYAQMITVAMGDGSGEERQWFDAALERQVDHADAYGNYLYSLLPRWSGTHSQMYNVGLACLAGGRFDTRVPARLLDAVERIEKDQERPLDRRQLDKVYPPIMECVDGYLANADRDAVRDWAASEKLVWSWRAGKFVEGKAFLDGYKGGWDDKPFVAQGARRDDVIGEVTLLGGPSAEAFAAARRHRLASARTPAYEALLATLAADDVARPWLASLLDAARFEATLESGEWVPVVVPADLKGWTVTAGEWTVEPDGALLGTAKGGLMIVHDQVLPDRYEVRFVVEWAAPQSRLARRFYIYPAWAADAAIGQWVDLTTGEGMLLRNGSRWGKAFAVPAGNSLAFHFKFDARAGVVLSLDPAGEVVASREESFTPRRRIAFGDVDLWKGTAMRIKNIEVRRK